MNKEIKINSIRSNTFIKNGGFFPLAVKHGDTAFVFCRTDAGHLGLNGKITVLASSNGTDWERRGTIAKDGSDARNPSAFIFPNGKMLVAAYEYNPYDENGFANPRKLRAPDYYGTLVYSSDDGGCTWTDVKADFSQVTSKIGIYHPYKIGRISPHGSMFMYDNRLLMPIYNRDGAFLLASKNEGVSWEIYTHIAADMMEPSVIKTPDNGLLAVLRTWGGSQSKWKAASVISRFTGGKWTEPAAATEHYQHPASLLALSDGRTLLTYAGRIREHQRILIKLSSDNGRSWSKELQIGKNFKNCDFGYPSTVEITPGKLLTVFYVNESKEKYSFYFDNPVLYTTEYVNGYYYMYSIDV